MADEPKVTGLSPMTGPPGTKITVRGENFGKSGDDIIRLTINGADCLPYLEWKSPRKIITRCTKALGSGDIIITTKSGGLGTCDVQFNCYEEVVGPNDESAVWVDEIDYQVPDKERLTTSSSNEGYSLEFSSPRFKPHLYITSRHSNATLQELEQLDKDFTADLAKLKDNGSTGGADLLKSDLPVIMECLHILEHLSKIITISRDTSIDNIVRSIRESLSKTQELFGPLLKQKDLVQSIESAMLVFRQNETLFNLPLAIENSIKSRNYDVVVKEVSAVLPRLKIITNEHSLSDKIQLDILSKVDKLKSTIELQLHQSCTSTTGDRSIDEIKKLIAHLNKLGDPLTFNVWTALKEMSASLIGTLSETSDHFLKLSLEEKSGNLAKINNPNDISQTSPNKEPPYVVQFVQNALNIFQNTYYDILSLGQAYFDPKDEFSCKESDDIKQKKQIEFEEMMISQPIVHLCVLLRLALVPDSPKLDRNSAWPSNETDLYVHWLKSVLQSVISCHINLTKITHLPPVARNALDDFKEFVFELRVRSMQILFGNATRVNKNLHRKEDWKIEVDDFYGGTTKLPLHFEKNVIETLSFANETIFKTNLLDEQSILKRHDVQASMKELAQSLINSLIDSLDNALLDSKEYPVESTRSLSASNNTSRSSSKYSNRLLITMCNCQLTKDQIFIRLQGEFEKLQGLKMDRVFKKCSEKYSEYISKLSDKFCKMKCSELSKSLKEAKTNNLDDLQINLMVVNSQIFLVAPQLVNVLMTSIVNTMFRERTSLKL